MKIKRRVFDYFSIMALHDAVKQNPRLQQMWNLFTTVLSNLSNHFSTFRVAAEDQF